MVLEKLSPPGLLPPYTGRADLYFGSVLDVCHPRVAAVLADGLHGFRKHMAEVSRQVSVAPAPAKVQRFVRMHEAGLPLDITVRWYPLAAVEAIEARVEKLTRRGRQVWISQGLPWDSHMDHRLASVERKTDLVKGMNTN